MTRRRRGLLLVGLALLLGGLAASDVARREAALDRHLSPVVPVVVARSELDGGRRVRARDVAVRHVPLRYAPADGLASVAEARGVALSVPVAAGAYLTAAHLSAAGGAGGPPPVRPGERAAEVVATGSPDLVLAGARVDVLITRDDAGRGATELALQDVEVLAAAPAGPAPEAAAGRRVAATLRVTLRQAVLLTAAQSFAREIRLLPRSPGDRRRAAAMAVGAGLR